MSSKRKAAGLLSFLVSIALIYLGFRFLPGHDYEEKLVADLGFAAWKSSICLASGLSILLIGVSILGVVTIPRAITLRLGALIIFIYAIWLTPLVFGVLFKWTFDRCYSISLFSSLLLLAINDVRDLVAKKRPPKDSDTQPA